MRQNHVINWASRAITAMLLISPVLSLAQDENSASLTIEVAAEFVPKRGTQYKVTQYADEQCGKRGKTERLFRKRSVEGRHTFKPLIVDTNQSFIFQVMFEQKKLRHLKSCSSIVNLTMEAGRNYKAVYEVAGDVLGCSLEVYDLSATSAVEDSEPGFVDGVVDGAAITDDTVGDGGPEVDDLEPTKVVYSSPSSWCKKVGKHGFKNNVAVHTELELNL